MGLSQGELWLVPTGAYYSKLSNTITVRFPKELFERLREASRRTGLSMNRIVCQSLEKTLPKIEKRS
jgi:predicted HicB family RNase H-like nuclease